MPVANGIARVAPKKQRYDWFGKECGLANQSDPYCSDVIYQPAHFKTSSH